MLVGSAMMGLDGPAVIALTADAKISLSKDRGLSWRDLIVNPMTSVYAASAVGKVLVAATGGSAVARSNNRGKSWLLVAGPLSANTGVGLGTGDNTVLLCGNVGGVPKMGWSTDKGATWAPAIATPFTAGYTINMPMAANGIILVGTSRGEMARSTDDGQSWPALVSNPLSGATGLNGFAYAGSGIWVAGGGYGAIIRSTDNGLTWASVSNPFAGSGNVVTIAAGGGVLIAANNAGVMVRSLDAGATWTLVTEPFTAATRGLVYVKGRWIAASDAGQIAYSDDNGFTWSPLIANPLGGSPVYSLLYAE